MALTLVHFPLDYHPSAASAANAYECSREQGDHIAFADRLFAFQDSVGIKPWLWFASAGVDTIGFADCLQSAPADEMVRDALAASERFAVSSTPTIVVNGWRYAGTPSRKLLIEIVEALLAGELPPGATVEADAVLDPIVDSSSGVEQIRYFTGALDALPRMELGAVPELTVGAGDVYLAEFDPSETTWAGRLPDGRLAIYSSRRGVLASFSSGGEADEILARRGRGPGEIARMSWPVILDDGTLVSVDRVNNRVTRWPTGDHRLKESPLPEGLPFLIAKPAGAFNRETILLHDAGVLRDGVPGTIVRPEASVGILYGEDSAKVVLKVEDLETTITELRHGGNREQVPIEVRMGLAAHVAVWDTMIAVANQTGFDIDVYSTDGILVRRISIEVPRRPLSPSMRSALVARDLELAKSVREPGANIGEMRRMAMEAPTADSLQVIGGLFPAADGGLWVLDQVAPGEAGWAATLFDRQGRPAGRLVAPRSERPVSFARDHVTTISKDDDGVVSVSIYRIMAPSLPAAAAAN